MMRLQNVSDTDRMVRILVGLIFFAAAYLVSSNLHIILMLLGILSVITGATGFCPLYYIFHINDGKQH